MSDEPGACSPRGATDAQDDLSSPNDGATKRRQERLARIGRLAATIGHDLRNPLGVIASSLFILRGRIGDDERSAGHLDKISKQVRTCEQIITDVLSMAADEPPTLTLVDVHTLLADAIEDLPRPDTVSFVVEVPDGLRAHADAGLLRQAVVNLAANAVAVLSDRMGQVTLAARRDARSVVIAVQDDGPGFDPAIVAQAFESGVTTRHAGFGLGLALVLSIAERHGGRVTAVNLESGGARVELFLPVPEILT